MLVFPRKRPKEERHNCGDTLVRCGRYKELPGAPTVWLEHLPPTSHSFLLHPQTMSSDQQPSLSLGLPKRVASFTHIQALVFKAYS